MSSGGLTASLLLIPDYKAMANSRLSFAWIGDAIAISGLDGVVLHPRELVENNVQ